MNILDASRQLRLHPRLSILVRASWPSNRPPLKFDTRNRAIIVKGGTYLPHAFTTDEIFANDWEVHTVQPSITGYINDDL